MSVTPSGARNDLALEIIERSKKGDRPVTIVLLVVGIQSVPTEVIEGAKLDGGSYWQRVRRIIVPLNYRILLLVTLVSAIGSMLAFEQFYIMTTGAPENQTITSVYWIYTTSFTYFKLGYGATLSIIGGCVILASLAGFGLARFSIPYKEFFFLLLICGMMIPYQTLLTPLYIMFSRLGIQNTRVGLAIVHTAIQLPFSIFLMRHSFEAVPRELEEAAVIGGCNSFQLLWRIFLPSVVPGIVTVALFAFLTSWNEFIGALIF
jgi:multiple sugar transport system permease protein